VAYPLDAPLTRDDKHAPGYAAIRVRHGAGSALSAHHPNGLKSSGSSLSLSKEIVKLAQCCGRPGAQRGPGSAAEGDQQARPYHHKAMKEPDNGKPHMRRQHRNGCSQAPKKQRPQPSNTSNPKPNREAL